jgi:hypothetical protein
MKASSQLHFFSKESTVTFFLPGRSPFASERYFVVVLMRVRLSASGHFPALRQTAPAPVPDKRLDRVGGAEYNEKNPGKKGKPNERKPKAPEGSPQGYPA